jgi:hypothetical protein
MVWSLLSSDVSQQPKDNQRVGDSVICAYTCESRGPALVAYHRPKLDGRPEGFHIYGGHLSEFKSRFNCQIGQMGREREGLEGVTCWPGRSQFCDVRIETPQLRIVGARD